MSIKLTGFEAGEGKHLVVLHGLFGSARNWNTVAKRLGDQHHVHALDMRNHGASPWSDDMSYAAMADDIRAYIEDNGLGQASVLGHSMGGKAAMTLALLHPELVEKLIVADIAPVAYRHTMISYVEAMQAVDLSTVTRRGEVDAQLKAAVPEAPIRSFLLQNLVAENGAFSWRINLAALADRMDEITGFPTADFDGRTLRQADAVRGRRAIGLCAGEPPRRNPPPVPERADRDHRGRRPLAPRRTAGPLRRYRAGIPGRTVVDGAGSSSRVQAIEPSAIVSITRSAGSMTVAVVPTPTLLSSTSRPSCSSTSRRASGRPSPVPWLIRL